MVLRGVYILLLLSLNCFAFAQYPRFLIEGAAQGTSYQLQYYAPRELIRKAEIDSVLRVIDRSMSLYEPTSLISAFNNPETLSWFEMDEHMTNVVKRSFEVHKRSGGMFDITVKPLVSLWGFGPKRPKQMPERADIDSTLQFVGMDRLELRKRKLRKRDGRISIDLNGIAQGYSVDVLAGFMERRGIENYIIELGGEIRTSGHKGGGEPFNVAIERPEGVAASPFILALRDKAVTTSGSYRRAFDFEGKKIHHHINPFDGYPLQNDIASVTVIAETAMDADAYDNVFMALTPEEGIRLADRLKGIEVYIIHRKDGTFKEVFSKGFLKFIKN